jgi:hypothetical protein
MVQEMASFMDDGIQAQLLRTHVNNVNSV